MPTTGQAGSVLAGSQPAAHADLPVALASYVDDGAASQASALDVAPDGTVVLGGILARDAAEGDLPVGGPAPVSRLGDGVLLRLAPAASGAAMGSPGGAASGGETAPPYTLMSTTRLGSVVEDLKVNGSGAIAVCGDFGVAVLDPGASSVQWFDQPGWVRRCALGEDGTVAALTGQLVYVYSPGGALLASWQPGGSAQNDVAVDTTRGLVVVTGFTNRRLRQGMPVQVSFLKAWSYQGMLQWTDYDLTVEHLGQFMADTRGVRVTMGRDGKLYFAGESAGGNSIFSRQPTNPQRSLSEQQLVRTDSYTNPSYNTSSNHVTWFGRYDPGTGALEMGQFLVARQLDSGRGNTIRPRAITADESGRVYLAGVTSASIENRDGRQIGGTSVGPYAGAEAFVLVLQPDLRQRLVWTTFTAPSPAGADPTHDSTATGVAVRNGVAAVAATLSRGALLAFHPLAGTVPGGPVVLTQGTARSGPSVTTTPGSMATNTATAGPGAGATATLAGGNTATPSAGVTVTPVSTTTPGASPSPAWTATAGVTSTVTFGATTSAAPDRTAGPPGMGGAPATAGSSPTMSVIPTASPTGLARPGSPATTAYVVIWPEGSEHREAPAP